MKPVSAIIRESIDPACGQAGEALADHAQDYEAWLEVQLEAERAAGEERYQEGLIAEARAIVAGTSNAHPQATHLWTVLDRLDRYAHRRRSHAPHPHTPRGGSGVSSRERTCLVRRKQGTQPARRHQRRSADNRTPSAVYADRGYGTEMEEARQMRATAAALARYLAELEDPAVPKRESVN